jgi:glycosyltransferase involved in cell wall biosynthesis
VLEAMQAGIACVVSQTTGHSDLITHEVNGALVPREQVENYADYLLQLLRDPALRQRWGNAARQRCETTFSFEKMLDATDRLYRRILDGNGGRK